MFIFYHREQSNDNTSYYKGILFEALLKSYLEKNGYSITLRQKHNSLEYDLDGKSISTGHRIVGEAKAHEKTINGQTVAAFVGKLLPLGLVQKKVHGLFLSTSQLSPDGEDYYRSIEDMGVSVKTGGTLYQEICSSLDFVDDNILLKKAAKSSMDVVDVNLLATDVGQFKLLVLKGKKSGTPSHFTLFNDIGDEVIDEELGSLLKSHVKALSGLEYKPFSEVNESRTYSVREIPSGLSVGVDWAEYRYPAAPNVFIGRENFISDIEDHIKSSEIPHVIQIKSRSGVGKSSLVSFLEDKFKTMEFKTELHDSRDVKSIYDIYSLIARFTNSVAIPRNYVELEKCLTEFSVKHSDTSLIFFVDQFESTFSNPELFDCYQHIAEVITLLKSNIYMILARKNDQLTTYDDSKVTLDKINNLSKSFTLPDFSVPESILLLSKINENHGGILSKEILPYIIEFAQGFPWLLKRTIAHILKLTKKGEVQRELIGAGLKLNDLFEEELEGLDELERDYLVRIVSKLPADFRQLQYHFDEDPMLVKVLDKLTSSKLVRLSGSTYDTYNDVFKEYLVYEKLPEFRQLTIYRMSPGSVISHFHKIITLPILTIEKIKNELDVSEGFAFNLVKELRNLDLFDSSKVEGYYIPANIKDLYSQGRLAGYLRRKLLDNEIVEKMINSLQLDGQMQEQDLPTYFAESYPFIEASEKTWGFYSTVLKSWLLSLKIIVIEKNGVIKISNISHSKAISELGNLNVIAGMRAGNRGLFFPVTSYSMMTKVAQKIIEGNSSEGKEENKAEVDLKNAGILVGDQIAVASIEELKDVLTAQLLVEGYAPLWDAIKSELSCTAIFKSIAGEKLSDATIKWRFGKVTALAKILGIIPDKRIKK